MTSAVWGATRCVSPGRSPDGPGGIRRVRTGGTSSDRSSVPAFEVAPTQFAVRAARSARQPGLAAGEPLLAHRRCSCRVLEPRRSGGPSRERALVVWLKPSYCSNFTPRATRYSTWRRCRRPGIEDRVGRGLESASGDHGGRSRRGAGRKQGPHDSTSTRAVPVKPASLTMSVLRIAESLLSANRTAPRLACGRAPPPPPSVSREPRPSRPIES